MISTTAPTNQLGLGAVIDFVWNWERKARRSTAEDRCPQKSEAETKCLLKNRNRYYCYYHYWYTPCWCCDPESDDQMVVDASYVAVAVAVDLMMSMISAVVWGHSASRPRSPCTC